MATRGLGGRFMSRGFSRLVACAPEGALAESDEVARCGVHGCVGHFEDLLKQPPLLTAATCTREQAGQVGYERSSARSRADKEPTSLVVASRGGRVGLCKCISE